MTLDDILARVKRLFFTVKSPTATQAANARTHRHDVMVRLQQEVRQLQRDIVDLSEREEASGAADPMAESEEMASLHRQLSRKQAELARYQARI